MQIEQATALVTGANRGIGRALALALVRAGARKVYAAARDLKQLGPVAEEGGSAIVPLQLDVTDEAQIARAAERASDISLLFNNAGVWVSGSVLSSSRAQLELELATNYIGTLNVTRAFVPVLERTRPSGIVNVLSVVSLAAMPALGGYSASKAAENSMSQALRAELAPRGIEVFGVFPGPIDTDMTRAVDMPKTSPGVTAAAIVAGVAAGQLDIFPDPMSQTVRDAWSKDPNALTRQFASM